MRARRPPILLSVLAAAALAGCAGGDAEESNRYVAAVNEAQTAFSMTSQRLQQEIEPGAANGSKGTFTEFYAAVDDFVARLRRIDPPTGVRALHERLIASMVRFGADLRTAGDKIASRNAGRILDGQEELADASGEVARELNSTIKAINTTLQE